MNKEFEVHMLNEQGQERAKQIAQGFDLMLEGLLRALTVESRELSLCRTKMEEACFYAKKAMSMCPEYQA